MSLDTQMVFPEQVDADLLQRARRLFVSIAMGYAPSAIDGFDVLTQVLTLSTDVEITSKVASVLKDHADRWADKHYGYKLNQHSPDMGVSHSDYQLVDCDEDR